MTAIQVEELGPQGFVSGGYPFRARLRLRGQQRELAGTVVIRADGRRLHAEAVFPLRLSDFDIARPAYLGVGVSDELTVRVKLTALMADRPLTSTGSVR